VRIHLQPPQEGDGQGRIREGHGDVSISTVARPDHTALLPQVATKGTEGQFEIKDEKQRRPFDTYFQTWLDTYVKAHCKERTDDLYRDIFRLHLLPSFGQQDIATITREDVKRLAHGLLTQGKSRSAAKSVLTPLSGMFSMAVEDGHVTGNPAARILRSRAAEGKQQERLQPLTREEVNLLLETCRESHPGH
jgi:site-specific recombinase XerD